MRRRSLRDHGAARGRGLLPLHSLPAPDGDRGGGIRAHRPGIARRDRRHGSPPRLVARGWVGEGFLRRLRLGDLLSRPHERRRRRRSSRRDRRRPARPPVSPAVRRLRGAVGADSRRRAAALRRACPSRRYDPRSRAAGLLTRDAQRGAAAGTRVRWSTARGAATRWARRRPRGRARPTRAQGRVPRERRAGLRRSGAARSTPATARGCRGRSSTAGTP